MRVRDHVVLSTAAAALLGRRARRSALGLWAGGVLIDVDHYAWFCLRQRRVSLLAAVQMFNQVHPPQHRATRALHSPLVMLPALVAGVRFRWLLPVAVGMSFHIAADAYHRARTETARAAALARDKYSCRACGTPVPNVAPHTWRQPFLLPSYRPQNFVSLCDRCHEAAHAGGGRSWN